MTPAPRRDATLSGRIREFDRRLSQLRAEIDRLPPGDEQRSVLEAFVKVADSLAILKSHQGGADK
jgi:hypothetical protein